MEKIVELSRRMQAAADMVSSGNRVCDVGCDHGYVSIYLVQSGKSPSALAMDVNQGPLLRAKGHVRRYGVEPYITLRLSDGLSAYRKGEADSLICAGMGGRLLWKILTREPDKTADFKELILQPQSEIALFRRALRENGYVFLEEDMILEEGKFYPLMKVRKAGRDGEQSERKSEEQQEVEDLLGPLLLKTKNPVLFQFIERELSMKKEILNTLCHQEENERTTGRKRELEREIVLLERAEMTGRM